MCKLVEMDTIRGRKCKVAEIKRDYILNIIENAQKCPAIDRIILFGSATEERCTPSSDIDIAIFGNKTEYRFLTSKEYLDFSMAVYQYGDFQDYDILYFKTGKQNKGNVLEDIRKGEIIYERNAAD